MYRLIVVVVVAVTVNVVYSSPLKDEWAEFKEKHGKHYTEEEDSVRQRRRNEPWRPLAFPNMEFDGSETVQLRFGSKRLATGSYSVCKIRKCAAPVTPSRPLVLWKDNLLLKLGNLALLSVQNLVDCSRKQGNFGCNGVLMDNCFKYIQENNGIDSDVVYPYQGVSGARRFKRSGVVTTVFGYVDITSGNEAALQRAVADIGPIASAVDASHASFWMYKSGVYDDPSCSSVRIDIGILVAGYGVEQGKDYWLLKNEFGVDWGMEGYILMARNKGNRCGVANQASYPIV